MLFIASLFILVLPVYSADISDDDFGRDDFLNRKDEKARSEEGTKYVAMFGAVPYIRTVYLEGSNSFAPNNAGIAFHAGISQSKHDDLPIPLKLYFDFGIFNTGVEVLQSDGSWWGAAGDKMNGLWADIIVEGGLKLDEFIRPSMFIGYSYIHYVNTAVNTERVQGNGLCGGIGINFFILKELSVFYRLQVNTINFKPEVTGIVSGFFRGSSIAHYLGVRYCLYMDPYKTYLGRRKEEQKRRKEEKQNKLDPVDKPEFNKR